MLPLIEGRVQGVCLRECVAHQENACDDCCDGVRMFHGVVIGGRVSGDKQGDSGFAPLLWVKGVPNVRAVRVAGLVA